MRLKPITVTAACEYVRLTHRHHRPPQGGLFAVSAEHDEKIVGVAIIGRPVARMLQDGWTCEITRLSTDTTRNACSMLYRAAARMAKAGGYRRVLTYTLAEESGESLRGAGFIRDGTAGGGEWSRPSRLRETGVLPIQLKTRWSITFTGKEN